MEVYALICVIIPRHNKQKKKKKKKKQKERKKKSEWWLREQKVPFLTSHTKWASYELRRCQLALFNLKKYA